MKVFLTNFFIFIYTLSFSQSIVLSNLKEYQSESNSNYWKNRKPHASYWQQDISYHINATFDDSTEIITGQLEMAYTNNSPDTLYVLKFHLYQNAFQPNSYLHNMEKADGIYNKFGKYEQMGLGTSIENCIINSKKLKFEIDNTIASIFLENPILPNETFSINMDFKTYFDNGSMRRRMKKFVSHDFKHFDAVHWYPRICVYDAKFTWETSQHLGKEFYGEYGIYDVHLNLPNHYICEATGELQNTSEVYPYNLRELIDIKNFTKPIKPEEISKPIIANGTLKHWHFKAINVHDFAFTFDPTYRIGEFMYKNIKCIALAQEINAHAWQPTAAFVANVIQVYSDDFGMYAYPKIVAADARDGMEYPMITLNGGNWPGHKYVIAHEVGHNWFFGMVGNNETYRAALDEGFTQFLTSWSLKKLNNRNGFPSQIDFNTIYAGYFNHAINENTADLITHSDLYNSADRHGGGYSQVYYKTATMLSNLQYVLGEDMFTNAMKHYFNKWKFCHPYEDDFKQAIIEYTHYDLNWFFDQWFNTKKVIDYAIKKVKLINSNTSLKQYQYEITLKRKGNMSMPIDLEILSKDKVKYIAYINHYQKRSRLYSNHIELKVKPWTGWGLVNKTYKTTVITNSKITNVKIDPTQRLADINPLNNQWKQKAIIKRQTLLQDQSDFYNYKVYWKPDLWYNAIDGIKFGLNSNGNYYNFKHIYDITLWYNSQIYSRIISHKSKFSEHLDLVMKYKTRISYLTDMSIQAKYLDGIIASDITLEKSIQNKRLGISAKILKIENNDYMINPELASEGNWNNHFNLFFKNQKRIKNGNWNHLINFRIPFILSDYNYSGLTLQSILTKNINKGILKTRFFAQKNWGNVPLESQILLWGANIENMLDYKSYRAVNIYGYQHLTSKLNFYQLSMGGGLNIRGNANYLATNFVNDGLQTDYIYSGHTGLAINSEFEFDKFIKIKQKKWMKHLNVKSYLFTDMGWLASQNIQSGIRANLGIGSAFTYNFIHFNRLKPITFRVDIPFLMNRVPINENYLDLRFVFGLNRAF